MREPITIIGGGLAGLALGIGLRQREVPVILHEAGHYPRHRVCGEFISGRGQDSLARLGLMPLIENAGAIRARDVAFFNERNNPSVRRLPQSGLCLSRFVLDNVLAREFARRGGELHSGERWQGKGGAGIVRASGRRVEPAANGWRLFGLKVHARGVPLTADLEMHFVPSGYVGICRLPGGEVNICGLFRSQAAVPDLHENWRNWLGGPEGSALRARLAGAEITTGSFCSVAGLSLAPRRAEARDECCVGDALTMIPPVTGNGMSMAFESAELALAPLAAFSRGELSWADAQRNIARSCDETFRRRLNWAAGMQRALFSPPARAALLWGARWSWVWRWMFRLTR